MPARSRYMYKEPVKKSERLYKYDEVDLKKAEKLLGWDSDRWNCIRRNLDEAPGRALLSEFIIAKLKTVRYSLDPSKIIVLLDTNPEELKRLATLAIELEEFVYDLRCRYEERTSVVVDLVLP